jgi:hypothetical protein
LLALKSPLLPMPIRGADEGGGSSLRRAVGSYSESASVAGLTPFLAELGNSRLGRLR